MTATVSSIHLLHSPQDVDKSRNHWKRNILKVERLLYLNWILHLPPRTPRTPQTGVGHNWSCPGHGETGEKVQLVQNTVFFIGKKTQNHIPKLTVLVFELLASEAASGSWHEMLSWDLRVLSSPLDGSSLHRSESLDLLQRRSCIQPNSDKTHSGSQSGIKRKPTAQTSQFLRVHC